MWLLDATTFKLESFPGKSIPDYAILSHTWSQVVEDEVTFQDIMGRDATIKRGYIKIEHACRQAREDGLLYVWIDTCCIDKKSSAELSEAINSMYRWYKNSSACYAYLADVSGLCPSLKDSPELLSVRETSNLDTSVTVTWCSQFAKSRWFTRGWTLQELIAPWKLSFYGQDWNFIGSKQGLVQIISKITRIDQSIIAGDRPLESISIAKRISWAAERTTLRVEDEAYSLLGIFGVSMPMVYGEGNRAFIRLQEEIIKTSTDNSIFVWEPWSGCDDTSLFASAPSDFRNGDKIVQWHESGWDESYEMTNKGLRIKVPLLAHDVRRTNSAISLAILNCRFEDNFTGPIAIRLLGTGFLPEGRGESGYSILPVRMRGEVVSSRFSVVDIARLVEAKERSLIILKHLRPIHFHDDRNPKCWFRITSNDTQPDFNILDVFPRDHWNIDTGIVLIPPKSPKRGAVLLCDRSGRKIIVAFNYSEESNSGDPNFEHGVGIFQGERDMALKKAFEYCTLKSQFAVLRLSDFEQARVTMDCEKIMNELIFVVRVSLDLLR